MTDPSSSIDLEISLQGMQVIDTLTCRVNAATKTGFAYESSMEKHSNPWCPTYSENPQRSRACYERLQEYNLLKRCTRFPLSFASVDQIQLVHDADYIESISRTPLMSEEELKAMCSQLHAVFVNQDTWDIARLAVNATLQLTEKVVKNELKNAFALVRPPGHHAMENEACGFCIFNNVAIAAKYAKDVLEVKRILIVDWDVHHGQATQYHFYDDPSVLYFSIHRYQNGKFWPFLRESDYDFVGEGKGRFYNINVPLNETEMSNADYLAIFNNLLLPVAYEFNPQLILVSAGYDAAMGCHEGMMNIHPACFGYFTQKLMALANGKVVVSLEGGYCLESLAEGVAYTVKALLGDPLPTLEPLEPPKESLQTTLLQCISLLRTHWRSLCFQGESENLPLPELDHPVLNSYPEKKVPYLPTRNDPEPLDKEHWKMEKLQQLHKNTKCPHYEHTTCLTYSKDMMKHICRDPKQPDHPERPQRIEQIYTTLVEYGLIERCVHLANRVATREEILLVHTPALFDEMQKTATMSMEELLHICETVYNSIYLVQDSFSCALLSAGCLLNVVDDVCSHKSRNGVAIIRPPGHHAEVDKCMGFCVFNNVALAARYAQQRYNLQRILIVDWDVHHGNGTQRMFYREKGVLYISLHRYDWGAFYPGGGDGAPNMVGEGDGRGFNLNIAWNGRRGVGPSEYLAAFHNLVMPIAHEYNPELVLVSAGFDALQGDPLGGLAMTPECYGHLTHLLSSLAEGRVIVALEGGYNLAQMSQAMAHCVASLEGCPPASCKCTPPGEIGVAALRASGEALAAYWKCLQPFVTAIPRYTRMSTRSSGAAAQKSPRDGDVSVENVSRGLGDLKVHDKPAREGSSSSNRWLEEMKGRDFFAVSPVTNCPHLGGLNTSAENVEKILPASHFNGGECAECKDVGDNWVCIHCGVLLCGRERSEHMRQHNHKYPHHFHVLSCEDLSMWCYQCDAYVTHSILHHFVARAHTLKFGEDLPTGSGK